MKRTLFLSAVITFVTLLWSDTLSAQDDGVYRFDHGPYLQCVTSSDAHVFFTTSRKGFSKVQLRRRGSSDIKEYVTIKSGLIEADNTMNAIKVDGLEPDTGYEYRLVSKEITDFKPYGVKFGDSIASEWYKFRTLESMPQEISFVTIADLHADSDKLRKLVANMPMDKAQMVFFLGDVIGSVDHPDRPYSGYIDASVELFATEKPFYIVRGNHETRGYLARSYDRYGYRKDGNYYGVYPFGETLVIMLDCGEDKPDHTEVYAGLNTFDKYREEQAEWLKKVAVSDEYKNAKRRIVMLHIPPFTHSDEAHELFHGSRHVASTLMPVLNAMDIDLMMCGHTHSQHMLEKKEGVYNFPIVIDDNKSASFVTSSPEGIHVITRNVQGETTLDRVFK